MRRIQEKVRALQHQLEHNIRARVPDEAPIMSRIVRWAAKFVAKHSPGGDGRTPWERIRQETCAVLIAPFGGIAMYLQLTIVKRSKGDPAKKVGVYLAANDGTEESLIGIDRGVVKCRPLNILNREEKRSQEAALRMRGTIWKPAPGSDNQHVPVDTDDTGIARADKDDNKQPTEPSDDEGIPEVQPIMSRDKLHISRNALQKYGPTDGCPACKVIIQRGHLPGRLGYNHPSSCRARIIDLMKEDLEYRELL